MCNLQKISPLATENPEILARVTEPISARGAFAIGLPAHLPDPRRGRLLKPWESKPRRKFKLRSVTDNVESLRGTCACCDRDFTPARADARFCSGACKQRAYRGRLAGNALVRSTQPGTQQTSANSTAESPFFEGVTT
jgi:hypothetical protein